MKNKNMKLGALALTGAMTISMLAGCGNAATTPAAEGGQSTTAAEGGESTAAASELAGESITILNSKGEIQSALEESAKTFEEETGIHLEVLA